MQMELHTNFRDDSILLLQELRLHYTIVFFLLLKRLQWTEHLRRLLYHPLQYYFHCLPTDSASSYRTGYEL